MNVAIYSDIVCPWCYVGEHRFRRAVEATGIRVEVVFRPFQLNPDATVHPVPVMDYLRAKFGPQADAAHDAVARMATLEGLPFQARQQLVVSTFDAHRVLRMALQVQGARVQATLMRKLFEAHFAERANVADTETLVTLAQQAGMDPAAVRAMLQGDEGKPELHGDFAHALGLGVQAVPTFVFADRYAVQGAQPVETFVRVLEQVEATRGSSSDGRGTIHR